MDLCFLCAKDFKSVFVDDKIISQVEYIIPEITITKLGIPLRICCICNGAINGFSKFKQNGIESSRRLEACIKGAQDPSVVDDNETSGAKPENIEEIFIKDEYMEETPLDTNRAFLDPIALSEPISAEPHNQLHEDRVSQNIQLHTTTNSYKIEEILIKEERIDEPEQDSELYNNVVKEECSSNSMNDDANTNEQVWNDSSANSEEETKDENGGDLSKNMQTDSFSCSECNKTFKHKRNLNQHIKMHSGLKKYRCNICDKSYAYRNAFNYHMKLHSNVKDFWCEICDKSFTQKCNLLSHMKIHSEVREFQCEVCNKSFSRKSHLNIHMNTHSEVRNFQCEICEKTFKWKHYLIYHMKLHSNTKEFQCEICEKSFIQKKHLNNHMNTHSR